MNDHPELKKRFYSNAYKKELLGIEGMREMEREKDKKKKQKYIARRRIELNDPTWEPYKYPDLSHLTPEQKRARRTEARRLCRLRNIESERARHASTNAKRNAQKRTHGSFTHDEVKSLYDIQLGMCVICGGLFPLVKMQRDNIVPIARGGWNFIWNIQLTCGPCNLRKHDKDPIEFMIEDGRTLVCSWPDAV